MGGSNSGHFQEDFYAHKIDYAVGSPHLGDLRLRDRLVGVTRAAVIDLHDREVPLNILEIGAGHGGYTEPMLALGCSVTAVDMSQASVQALRERFQTNERLTTLYDPSGDLVGVPSNFSMIACVSVLHHIPDYLAFIDNALPLLVSGGGFLCLQDPLWYDRVPSLHRRFNRVAYLSWRIFQGNLASGAATLRRRARGVYDENNISDMVEYHVVRQGVDERAIVDLLRPHFQDVALIPYWSTQLPIATRIGERLRWSNTFGIHAKGYRAGA